ncbi:MAG: MoxR family ATPase [Clostridia bacterium]|nr:MoxR family ATPase [Clostridia bacterium]
MSAEMKEKRDLVTSMIKEVEKVVIGKHNEILILVSAMLSGGHILIEDVPGVGKTTLAHAIAKCAGLKFRRAQFTPDVLASDITGFNIYNRSKECFEFREGLVMCNIFLADEINRASPKTQSALLEAMEEGRVTVDGVTYDIPSPFVVIATQNPAGYVGTYPLPEAQMDRFFVRISMGYPTEDEEHSIMLNRKGRNPIESLEAVVRPEDIVSASRAVEDVEMSGEVSRYIVKLVGATRNSELISLGASPRASIALMKVSKAYAFLRGRDYVTTEDVAAVYKPVVGHRIVLGQEARLSGMKLDEVLDKVSREVQVPFRSGRS